MMTDFWRFCENYWLCFVLVITC